MARISYSQLSMFSECPHKWKLNYIDKRTIPLNNINFNSNIILYENQKKICDDMGLSVEFEKVGGFDPVTFDETCVNAVRNAAERLGYSNRDIISGAGHDACWINQVAPTAMIMCPCVDGLSHNEAEEISQNWSTAGAEVLFHAVVETAVIVE